jgi:hypothetical protein
LIVEDALAREHAGTLRGESGIRLRYWEETRTMATLGDRQFTSGTNRHSARCSFCNKWPVKDDELIEGPWLPGRTVAYICRECVELCSSIFEHRKMLGGAEGLTDQSIINPSTRKMLEEKIDQSLSTLTGLESEIIRLRYGLTDGCVHSCEEIGHRLDIVPERVAELEKGAIARLRGPEQQADLNGSIGQSRIGSASVERCHWAGKAETEIQSSDRSGNRLARCTSFE